MSNDALFMPPVLYTGPPPSPQATHLGSPPPTIITLSLLIITSADKLFFIAHKIGNATTHEWHLIHVAFCNSLSLYPSALQDSHFLVEFYITHPNNVSYNATNQPFWLQYCEHNVPDLELWMSIWRTTHYATTSSHFAVGLTLLMRIHTSTVHSTSQLFAAWRLVIGWGRLLGMRLSSNPSCSSIRYQALLSNIFNVDHGINCVFHGMTAAFHIDDLLFP